MTAMTACIHDLTPTNCAVCNGTDVTPPKRGRGRPMQRHEWAEKVRQFLPALEVDQWTPASDLAAAAGLTVGQVSAGIEYLRDEGQMFPLVSSSSGYRFSVDPEDIAKFQRWRLRTGKTVIRRAWTGVVKPSLELVGDPVKTRVITKQFERLLEDIEELTA